MRKRRKTTELPVSLNDGKLGTVADFLNHCLLASRIIALIANLVSASVLILVLMMFRRMGFGDIGTIKDQAWLMMALVSVTILNVPSIFCLPTRIGILIAFVLVNVLGICVGVVVVAVGTTSALEGAILGLLITSGPTAATLYAGLAIHNHQTNRRSHCCVCRYDLTGNLSGICPECGTAVKAIGGGKGVGSPL